MLLRATTERRTSRLSGCTVRWMERDPGPAASGTLKRAVARAPQSDAQGGVTKPTLERRIALVAGAHGAPDEALRGLHVLVNDIWGATRMEWNKSVWESSGAHRLSVIQNNGTAGRMAMDVRDANEAEIDWLAQLWFDGWQDAHAEIVPPELKRLRTLESFRDRLRAALPHTRVVGPVVSPVFDSTAFEAARRAKARRHLWQCRAIPGAA